MTKELYDLGEMPPLGSVPKMMHAFLVRQDRFGEPKTAWQREVIPVPAIGPRDVLVYVMATGINYNITSAGVIGGTSDQFRFAYRQVTGDFDIAVRVAALTNLGGAEAGLMAREFLNGNSKNIFAFALNSKGYRLSSRSTAGGKTATTGSGAASYPNTWIRLKRVGNTFTAFRSVDGKTWTRYATQTMVMNATLDVGMACTSGITSSYITAYFKQMRWY